MHIALPKSRGDKLPPSEQRIGYLAAKRDASLGYVGGYLITTARGRPIEFHYTTPVKPSPTHRILYGAELEPYIFGELIGSSLIKQSSLEVAFIVTDQPQLLEQRKGSSSPIVCIAHDHESLADRQGPEHQIAELRSHADYPEDAAALNRWIEEVHPGLNLREPFVRVWEALREVLGAETKSQAA